MTKEEQRRKQERYIHIGMISTYLQLIENKGYGEVVEIQKKHKVLHSFFIPPVDVDTGDILKSDIESMIDHFIEQEDYKKCSKLQNFINTNKCDEDGWLYFYRSSEIKFI